MTEPTKSTDEAPAAPPPADGAKKDQGATKATEGTGLTGRAWWAAFVLAVFLVLAYVVVEGVLLALADDKNTTDGIWTRYLVVIGGLEAIVFTAVGWVFGREVNRGAAEAATKSANDAKDDAKDAKDKAQAATQSAQDANAKAIENAEAAANGRSLAETVKTLTSPRREASNFAPGQGPRSTDADLEILRALANRLFPD